MEGRSPPYWRFFCQLFFALTVSKKCGRRVEMLYLIHRRKCSCAGAELTRTLIFRAAFSFRLANSPPPSRREALRKDVAKIYLPKFRKLFNITAERMMAPSALLREAK